MRKSVPVARRIFGESNELTVTLKKIYAEALYKDSGATLDDLLEAVIRSRRWNGPRGACSVARIRS